jgi:hypothetical protein
MWIFAKRDKAIYLVLV